MPFGLDLGDIVEAGRSLNPFDDEPKKKPKKKPRRPKVPESKKKAPKRPEISHEYDVPIPKAALPAIKAAAIRNRRRLAPPLPPPRPHGWRGFLDDITEGRGVLGLATTGPISLFARDDARDALFHGHLGEAGKQAVAIGRYRPPKPGSSKSFMEQEAGPGRLMEWLGNVNRGVNVLPSMFADVGEVASRAVASDVSKRRGILGLATTGPIGALANPKARKALFAGHIEEAIKQTVPDWDAPTSESSKLSKEILVSSIKDTKRAFSDPNYWYDDPVNAAFAAAIVLGPVSRAAGIARTASRLKAVEGATAFNRYKVAVAESFHPGISGLQQGVRRQIPTGRGDQQLDITPSRHPFGRALQRQYDLTTKAINPEARFLGPLAAPRRARRLEARRTELGQRRLQGDVNLANRKAALYINEGLIGKGRILVGDSLRRGRDSAIVMALMGPKGLDAAEAVKYAINDTDDILERGTAYAPDGDIADLTVVPAGQEAFLDGQRVRVSQTVVGQSGEPRATAIVVDTGETVEGAASRFKLVNEETGERARITLTDDQKARLVQRSDDLKAALHELETNPKQRKKFDDAVDVYTQLGSINEDLGHVISKATVGSAEWQNFLEGGRVRRSLMARRWRKQGLRAGEEDLTIPVTDHANRTKFVDTITNRLGAQAAPLIHLADRMARSAAETARDSGRAFDAAAWWDRLHDTSSGVYNSASQVGDFLYHSEGPRVGMVGERTPDSLGIPLHGTVAKRGPDGTWWWGITDHGDGTVRAWSASDGWTDDLPINNIRGGSTNAGFDEPLRVGEKVEIMEHGTYSGQTGKVSGYHELDRGPEVSIIRDDGSTVYRPRHEVSQIEGAGQDPIFYSKSQQVISSDAFPAKATPQQVMKALEKAGVKKEELIWTGIEEFAELYPGKSIPKEDLLNHLENSLNGINLNELVRSSLSSRWPTKWGSYSDGGLIIREPSSDQPYYELVMQMPGKPGESFTSGHFPEQGYIFHIRFHEIVDEQGRKAILIDELQSDLHASGRRRGYKQPIPKDVQAEIDRLNERRNAIRTAQNSIADGHHLRYDVEEAHKAWVNEQIDHQDAALIRAQEGATTDEERIRIAQEHHPEALTSRSYRYSDMLRDTDWETPEIVARLEEMFPGYAEKAANNDRYQRLNNLASRLDVKIGNIENPYLTGVPDYPFKNDAWMSLAMKRLVQWGVDNGQTRIYWTRGHEHMVRYGKYSDLPTEGRRDLDPSNYGDEFYNSYASSEESFGDSLLGKEGPMQEPLEGMNLALLEKGEAPSQPVRMSEIPPERGFADPDEIDADLQGQEYVVHNGRFAKILDWDDEREGWDIEYVPARLDPWNVQVRYNGYGDYSANYDVTVTNRLGEELFQVDLEDVAHPGGYSDFWEDVAKRVDATIGERALIDAEHRVTMAKNPPGGEPDPQRITWAEENLVRVKAKYDPQAVETARMLGDIERSSDIPDNLDRNMQTELDEDRWEEWLHEQGGGAGDFDNIRDFQSHDADPSKSHLYMYDSMLPKTTGKTFKEFGVKPFYEEHAYTGRYSTEGEGVISDEGVLPAHGIDITDEMAQSVRDARQSMFQQPVDGNAVPKGALEFIKGTIANPEQVALRLFDDADASTVIHELGHVGLYDLHPRDLRIIEEELQGGKQLADWDRTEHERFARAFERFIMGEPAMNPKLTGPFQQLAEIMQAIYSTIKGYFDDIPVSPAVEEVFDRMVNPRSADEARGYFPHRSAFDLEQTDVLGGTRLPAGGATLGVPRQDRRAFPNKPNAEVLWETGEMNPSTGALSTQVVRRGRYHEALRIRRSLYNEGHVIKADEGIPPGAYLVRDPDASVEKIPQRVTAAQRLDEQSFRELTGDKDVEDWKEALKLIVLTPDEMGEVGVNMKNVRWVEPWKVESAVRNVFPSSPKGKGAAALGMVNTATRMSQIYLRPIRYMTGNVPANVVLVALTNPTALPRSMRYLAEAIRNSAREFGKGPSDLVEHHPALYNAIRGESGDVMAGAGLPEFYTQANNGFQKSERRLNRMSQEVSDRLGEIADQPFRVAVWITWAKRYGYKTPADWEHLLQRRLKHDDQGRPLEQLSPEEERIRDEIAQRTREDMIDFNAMTPWERQHIGRFFYLWAFTRGFIKWPLTFAREYPERLAGVGLASEAFGDQASERELPKEYYDARGQSTLRRPDGTGLDFSSWNPISGGVDAWNAIAGLSRGNVRGVSDYISPALTAAGEAMFDPTKPQGWGEAGREALDTFVPAWGQQAISKTTGLETAASRRSEATGLKGRWKEINDILEVDRFSQGRYSPSITKKRTADWKDLTADYSVSTAHYSAEDVTKSYQAYWRYKEYEQRVKYGIAEREGRQGLSDKEKAIVLRRVAAEVYGDDNVASVEEIEKADTADLAEFVSAMDWMFKARTSVMSAATRRRNEQRQTAGSVTR